LLLLVGDTEAVAVYRAALRSTADPAVAATALRELGVVHARLGRFEIRAERRRLSYRP